MKTIICVLVPTDGRARRYSMAGDIASRQKAVGGYVEVLHGDGFAVLCDEEGLIHRRPPNKLIGGLVGDVLLVKKESLKSGFTRQEADRLAAAVNNGEYVYGYR